MGRGESVQLRDPGRVVEVALLHEALRDASVAIRQRERMAEGERAAFERENHALQAADTAKDEFIAMLSHELRNPLAALTTAVHLLKLAKVSDPLALQARDVADRFRSTQSRRRCARTEHASSRSSPICSITPSSSPRRTAGSA
jgi:signal transduction histidine kinase